MVPSTASRTMSRMGRPSASRRRHAVEHHLGLGQQLAARPIAPAPPRRCRQTPASGARAPAHPRLGTSRCPSRNSRPTGRLVDDLGRPRRQPHDVAVADREHLAARPQRARAWRARPDGAASPCMGMAMRGLTQAYISFSSSRRGWPVTCTSASPSVTSSQPRSTSRFWMRAHRALVAGDGARGEDDEVALVELDGGMLVVGDAGHRRARLALAARAQQHHLVGLAGTRTAPGRDT